MAKRYDPIMCMMVDEPAKAQDAKSYGKYKLPNGEIVEVIDRKNVHGVDTIVYKNSRGVHFATVDWFMSNAKKVRDSAKAKDKLVKVPDNKLKDFEANLRSAGFKVVSKSDRGMSTHYQVEVNSSKQFTEADLREWANKIDAVCDKMDSAAPTTWNIGLTADGKITAGLDVREMYVKDSASALDKAIKTADASNIDIDHVANYLWTWENGSDVARQLFFEGLEKYPGPHTPEHKDPAYKFAADYASKELNNVYSKLKSAVDKKLKSGYEKSKQNLNNLKNG